ncbi:hypothetical protein [Rheinheimera sp. F8]|uniref:DUF7004 family protein n=1 Tax=Rheinheimera sp. F8 TaxID=1763998 RepID=UPI000744C2E8|nr:hypothetical protein [Rheinheimera sp. F8]ALZ76729.1 hypothetical protein ATY27_13805 [Rheinheimera sp. F8]
MAFVVTQRFAEQSSEIATLLDGTQLVFSQGKFDCWCIYHIRNGFAHALRDEEVFSLMQKYTGSIQRFWLYKDFLTVFKLVTTDINCGDESAFQQGQFFSSLCFKTDHSDFKLSWLNRKNSWQQFVQLKACQFEAN